MLQINVPVTFELVRTAPLSFEYNPVRVYELPAQDDEEPNASAAEAAE